ncbi:MAG TPA: sialidase family protein [Candidatus Dormibacteraeota bacterium]
MGSRLRLVVAISSAVPILGFATQAFPVQASSASTPFSLSGIAAESRQPSLATLPPGTPTAASAAARASGALTVGSNVNVIGSSDVVQQATINGVSVKTCNPGKHTAQNETTIASNGSVEIGGTNDYRLYEPSENRYDGSGGFYLSTNGGKSWSAGFLPGLVRANPIAPGPYESAGDPAVVAGPVTGTFWYANLAFDRTDAANSVAVSRTTDGGQSWATHFVLQTSAVQGVGLFNDKEWIGTDPNNADVAYVTWTQFNGASSAIVVSRTADGGVTWSSPKQISTLINDQGSTVVVDGSGTVYVTFETFTGSSDAVAFAVSTDGGSTFSTKLIAPVADIPSPLPGATFRDDSFPALALDPVTSALHVVWSNWNGTDADVVYIGSTDGGATWSPRVTIAGGAGDQFFPWVAASGGKVYASWFNRPSGGGDTYSIAGAASSSGGGSWTLPVTLSTAVSNVKSGNQFQFPSCLYSFIGDYNAITVDSSGVAHALWTDIRDDHFDPPSGGADQDPYTATLSL